MPLNPGFPFKISGNDHHLKVTAAVSGPCMAGMEMTFVHYVDAFGGQGRLDS